MVGAVRSGSKPKFDAGLITIYAGIVDNPTVKSADWGLPMSVATAVPVQATTTDQAFWKITLRLMPYLALLWCLAWIDRVNIGFAKLTMLDDLKFSEAIYGLGAGMFFLGYFIFEVPSNLLLKKIGARKTLMRITIPSMLLCCLGVQIAVTAFFAGLLDQPKR